MNHMLNLSINVRSANRINEWYTRSTGLRFLFFAVHSCMCFFFVYVLSIWKPLDLVRNFRYIKLLKPAFSNIPFLMFREVWIEIVAISVMTRSVIGVYLCFCSYYVIYAQCIRQREIPIRKLCVNDDQSKVQELTINEIEDCVTFSIRFYSWLSSFNYTNTESYKAINKWKEWIRLTCYSNRSL